jgi:hypothetical protein
MAVYDPVYKQLADEKLAGWESEAVSELWKSRTRKFKVQSSGNRAEDSRKFTPEDTKYFNFYCDVLSKYAPGLFLNTGSDEKFIDIGSAPGGLSRFLNSTCGWSGYAFSLAPTEGGLQMKYSNPRMLRFSMANMTKENEWKRVVELAGNSGFKEVGFVNMGVVVDYGQVESDNGDSGTMACRAIYSSVSQFLIMISLLKEGGSAMWIHSLSHLDTFFWFLRHCLDCFDSVRLLNTLAPSRSPVYVILRGFRKPSVSVAKFKKELLTDHGVIGIESISKWQVSDFRTIQDILETHPSVKADIHTIWDQKRECLKQTREFAERRFTSSNRAVEGEASTKYPPAINSESKSADVSRSIPNPAQSKQNVARLTAAVICGVGSLEAAESSVNLLEVPRTFGPVGRRKPSPK